MSIRHILHSSFNLRIEILIVDSQKDGTIQRRTASRFNLRIEILIVDSLLSMIRCRSMSGFNLRIEILIVDRRLSAARKALFLQVSISELRFLSLIEPTVSDLCW